jgi:hypothetical protein
VKNALTIGLVAWSFLFAGCATGPDSRKVLNWSHDAMREVQSYRFSGEIKTMTPDGDLGGRQYGEWVGPGQWYMRLEAMGEFAGQTMETVVVGQRVFTRELHSHGGTWRESPHISEGLAVYNPRPESYLAVPHLENLRLLDDIVVNGTATFQITGEQRETRTLPPRFPERPEGDEVEWVTTYTWLIAKEDHLLVRYIIEEEIGLGRATHRNTWDFYDYNQPVTIEMPEINGQ